ncbi:MAG TPA: hypothetical protein VHC47_00455 [Mucilaginibacter sp.]|nr:hypothetical protein [Mucilaginibacter sp.]
MKATLILLFTSVVILASCSQGSNNSAKLQSEVDSLKQQVAATYKPGLGEFMLGIQEHHAKLWFAGINKNWELADFEVHEIGETLDDIKQYCTDRPEVKSIGMIDPGINAVEAAIKQKDLESFRKGFIELTGDCNTCHKDNQHGFNVITIPTSIPVFNQEFKPAK